MKVFHCDHCARPIAKVWRAIEIGHAQPEAPASSTDVRPAHLCDIGCLRGWLEVNYPQRRPNFDAAREVLADVMARDELAMAGAYDDELVDIAL